MRLLPFGVADGAANVKAPTKFALGNKMRREGELAAQGLPWFRRNPGILPVTIIIDAGFVNRVARFFLLLNKF
jgi:hypothetical protein